MCVTNTLSNLSHCLPRYILKPASLMGVNCSKQDFDRSVGLRLKNLKCRGLMPLFQELVTVDLADIFEILRHPKIALLSMLLQKLLEMSMLTAPRRKGDLLLQIVFSMQPRF